jgi:quercetin dioxygenase-like cupin family protein
MRLAPGAVIPEHHHPAYDETFLIYSGSIIATLNGVEHRAQAGDVVVIPAGTVIVGRNAGSDEAVVVVVFSGNGRGGPLTVPGRPMH